MFCLCLLEAPNFVTGGAKNGCPSDQDACIVYEGRSKRKYEYLFTKKYKFYLMEDKK